LNLIQPAIALPTISVGPVKSNAAIPADVSGFALALGALMPKIAAPVVGLPGKAGDAAVPLAEGQDLAETGKDLPDAVLGLDGKSEDQPGAETDGEDDTGTGDAPPPPFAWFAITPPPAAQPEAKVETTSDVAIETGGKPARRDVQLPEVPVVEAGETKAVEAKTATTPVVATPTIVPEAKPQPARRGDVQRQPKTDAAVPRAAPADAADVPVAEASDEPKTPASDSEAQTGAQPVLAPAPRELRKAAAEAPVVRIALDQPAPQQKVSIADITQNQRQAAAIPAPISQPIADQIVAAFELPQTRTSRAAADPQVDLSTLAASATGTQTAAAVTATGPGQDAMLDTRDQQWTAKMIDKIEALQGGGPVRETRLSLMPEGLGKIDISIRQDDAGVHVQFNTDTQAARQLIADAQPKLAEIAQERGIRLGSTSVESNATGTGAGTANPQMNQGQRNDAQPQRNQPSAPPSARREAQSSTNSDERVA
jgi:flagellar hook-length control protein FliK